MAFWTYILLCAGDLSYAGHTDDLPHRIAQHQTGAIEGFTSSRLPVRLMGSQDFPIRFEAREAEARTKAWSHAKKEALIRGDWNKVSHFAKPPKDRQPASTRDAPLSVRIARSREAARPGATPMGGSISRDTNEDGLRLGTERGDE